MIALIVDTDQLKCVPLMRHDLITMERCKRKNIAAFGCSCRFDEREFSDVKARCCYAFHLPLRCFCYLALLQRPNCSLLASQLLNFPFANNCTSDPSDARILRAELRAPRCCYDARDERGFW